ncbi:class F sortase [Arthrobacter glacialis]|nr:class F sortase [Arthrobacter glacialis]
MSTPKKRGLFLPILLVLVLLAGGAAVMAMSLNTTSDEAPSYAQAPSIDKPFTTTDPNTFAGPTTANEALAAEKPLGPMELSVPSVGLRVSLVESGITPDGVMSLPASNLAGHYSPAAPIGATEGSTVIAGHVNYADGSIAPMGLLAGIQKGAPIFITDAAGTVHRYQAVDAQLIGKHALPETFFTTTGNPQLVLLTCGGDIASDATGVLNFLDNTAITATPWP